MKKSALMRFIAVGIISSVLLSACEPTPEKNVIAKVGGSTVYLAEFDTEYEYYLDYTGIKDGSDESASLRQQIIDYMVARKVELEFAKEKGLFELTEEQEKEVLESFDELIANWLKHYEEQVTNEDSSITGDALRAEAEKKLDAYIKSIGYTRDRLFAEEREYYITNKLYEKITEGITVTDEMAEIEYNDRIADKKDEYAKDPTAYQKLANSNKETYYVPAGVRKVKHILIELTTEQKNEISELRMASKDDEADAKREEFLATIEEKTNEVRDLLEPGGTNFDEIAKKHTADSGLEYYLLPNGAQMIPEFTEAGLALERVGDISGLVGGDYGYHIMLYSADVPEGPTQTFEKAKESIIAELIAEKGDEKYSEEVEAFKKTLEIKIYTKKLDLEVTSK